MSVMLDYGRLTDTSDRLRVKKGGDRILIVDDDAEMRALLKDFLRLEGFEAAEADSEEKAIALVQTLNPSIVLLDLIMPGE